MCRWTVGAWTCSPSSGRPLDRVAKGRRCASRWGEFWCLVALWLGARRPGYGNGWNLWGMAVGNRRHYYLLASCLSFSRRLSGFSAAGLAATFLGSSFFGVGFLGAGGGGSILRTPPWPVLCGMVVPASGISIWQKRFLCWPLGLSFSVVMGKRTSLVSLVISCSVVVVLAGRP